MSELLHEVPHELGNIGLSVAERWQRDRESIQPIVEIFAEFPVSDQQRQIPIGRGNDTDINAETRKDWIAALDKIEALKPVAVIAGHKRPGAPDTPNNIEETRKYIRDFDRIVTNTKTASELYNQMLAIYPERVNPAVLWLSARAMKLGI